MPFLEEIKRRNNKRLLTVSIPMSMDEIKKFMIDDLNAKAK